LISPRVSHPASDFNRDTGGRLTPRACLVLCLVLIGGAWTLDNSVANALELRSFPALHSFARAMSLMGEGWVVAVAGLCCAGLFAVGRRARLAKSALVVTFAALLTGATATLLRCLIGRTRPHAHVPQGVYGVWHDGHWIFGKFDFGSFPSGHAATAFALVAALWLANRRAGIAAIPYALLVCWSRLAQGSHHFSDVAAAACLGVLGARFFARRLDPVLDAAGRGLEVIFGLLSGPAVGGVAAGPSRPDPAAAAAAIARLKAAGIETSGPLLTVVIPCYNEQGNLGPLTAAIARAIEPLDIDWDVLITDDCSSDNSWRVLNELAAASPRIRGQRLARNSGQSAAIWAGIRAARGQFVATMDADMQNSPDDLPVLLATLETCDCVCGTRIASRKHGDSIVRRIASRFANAVRNWLTHESITDSACGYRVFRRECVQNLKYFRGMHRFIPTLIRIEGFAVAEVPITHRSRLSGHSHYGLWDRVFTSFYDLLAVRWMQKRMVSFRIEETANLPIPLPRRRRSATARTGAAEQQPDPRDRYRRPAAHAATFSSVPIMAAEPIRLPNQ
jgi:dolichol-phosphate mannosyltransferase